MGCPTQLQLGLVDAGNALKMDGMLKQFESRWNELERPYNSPPSFYAWFLKHCRENVAKYMLQDVREKAGLGSPSPYYTNEVEYKNKVLKEVQYKSSQLPDFIHKMRRLMEEQKLEIEHAVIGAGEYRIRSEYDYLVVESSKWFKMTTEQRKRKVDKFMEARVQEHSNSVGISDCPLVWLSLR